MSRRNDWLLRTTRKGAARRPFCFRASVPRLTSPCDVRAVRQAGAWDEQEKKTKIDIKASKNQGSVYFLGIGGSGLAPLARVASHQGWQVRGSDMQEGCRTRWLRSQGIDVMIGCDPKHLLQGQSGLPDVVVVTSAASGNNPVVLEARKRGIPVLKRSQWLPIATAGHTVVAVAGTHGKTTTAAMLTWMLYHSGAECTAVIGGDMPRMPHRHGAVVPDALPQQPGRRVPEPVFVVEADEYDRAFLGLRAHIAVVTSVEPDHPDTYPTLQQLRGSFLQFCHQVRVGGVLLLCADDANCRWLASQLHTQRPLKFTTLTYGRSAEASLQLRDEPSPATRNRNLLSVSSGPSHPVQLQTSILLPGCHNRLNATAALALAVLAQSTPRQLRCSRGSPSSSLLQAPAAEPLAQALASFPGVGRRFQVRGLAAVRSAAAVLVVDDYAHHPTAVTATVEAARHRHPEAKVVAAFQPHTFSRTRLLFQEFATAIAQADAAVVLPVFPARESGTEPPQLLSQQLVLAARHAGLAACSYAPDFPAAATAVAHYVRCDPPRQRPTSAHDCTARGSWGPGAAPPQDHQARSCTGPSFQHAPASAELDVVGQREPADAALDQRVAAVVLVMGAGDITSLSDLLCQR